MKVYFLLIILSYTIDINLLQSSVVTLRILFLTKLLPLLKYIPCLLIG